MKKKVLNHNNEAGMNQTTELCVDLKTQLLKDARTKVGIAYHGTLKRDIICEDFLYDDHHFTFTEEAPVPARKACPQVYAGQYVTVTRQQDGSYRPNLKPQTFNDRSRIIGYATQVGNELLWGLEGLLEENYTKGRFSSTARRGKSTVPNV